MATQQPAGFDAGLKFVLSAEGGYSDDPGDPGGATMHGITHSEYDAYRKEKGETTQDVRKISDAEVADIYRNKYWDAINADTLPAPLGVAAFDCAVNQGVGAARLLLTQSKPFDDPHAATGRFIGLRVARYRKLASNRPVMQKFLRGWINRMNALCELCGLSTRY